MPFLSEAIRRTLDLDAQRIELYRHTFHPQLPGLAFVGLWDQAGPYFPPLELQARWLAYAWSGAIAAPAAEEMQLGLDACRAGGGAPQKTKMNLIALLFARAAGVEPEPQRWPELRRALLFGPLAPVSFRLQGRDALPDAAARSAGEAMAFGCVQSPAVLRRRAAEAATTRAIGTAVADGSTPRHPPALAAHRGQLEIPPAAGARRACSCWGRWPA